jgi:beta-glucanase (GH16 family)
LDTSKWTAREQDRGIGNSGVRWGYKASNVRLNNGAVALDISRPADNTYGGARIDSQGRFDFTHGTIEYRMHVPPTIGHLGAAWLQASGGLTPGATVDGTARDGAEIDILESFSTGNQYGLTIHGDGYGDDHQSSNTTSARQACTMTGTTPSH